MSAIIPVEGIVTQEEIQGLFDKARQYFSQKQIAEHCCVGPRTVRRWERSDTVIKPAYGAALRELLIPVKEKNINENKDVDFTFIDLFAGIGGIRKGFESIGGKCIWTSEWNKYAQQTYRENFSMDHDLAGNITEIVPKTVPDHDVLLAGFPCQPFSIAGVSKKNSLGVAHGFACEAQGTLFFDVAKIIREKQPVAFLLENVKNLERHDSGNTFRVIMDVLENDLGYRVYPKVIDAKGFVPQHRERLYLVGFREETTFSWDSFRRPEPDAVLLGDILHRKGEKISEHDAGKGYYDEKKGMAAAKYTLSDNLWVYLQNYAAKHKAKGNGFGFGLVTRKDTTRTLSARYHKDGSEILVSRGPGRNPRRLTPRECARLMGYPDDFVIPVSDTQAYRQFGNSVVVPVIRQIAILMKPHFMAIKQAEECPEQQRFTV